MSTPRYPEALKIQAATTPGCLNRNLHALKTTCDCRA
jgi:hypothetical protein